MVTLGDIVANIFDDANVGGCSQFDYDMLLGYDVSLSSAKHRLFSATSPLGPFGSLLTLVVGCEG